jgi:DNA-binding NtrC family response regulator
MVDAGPDGQELRAEHFFDGDLDVPAPKAEGGWGPALLDLPFRDAMRRVETEFGHWYLSELCRRSNGVKSRMAALCGLQRTNLYREMDRYGVPRDGSEE